MKNLIAIVFAATSLLGGPAILVASSTPALAQVECGPGVPAEWLRPGGFCAQSGSTKSLSDPLAECPDIELFSQLEIGDRIHVACVAPCEVFDIGFALELPEGVRLHLAQSEECFPE
jgi:hypothetical protein